MPAERPPASAEILDQLFRVVAERRRERPAGSYVVKLLEGGVDVVGGKVTEEAGEVVEAARREADEAVAREAADLLFHLWVLLAARGLEPSAVYAVLAERFGIGGLVEKAARGREGREDVE